MGIVRPDFRQFTKVACTGWDEEEEFVVGVHTCSLWKLRWATKGDSLWSLSLKYTKMVFKDTSCRTSPA